MDQTNGIRHSGSGRFAHNWQMFYIKIYDLNEIVLSCTVRHPLGFIGWQTSLLWQHDVILCTSAWNVLLYDVVTSCLLNEGIASAPPYSIPKIRHGRAELTSVLPFFLSHILPSFISNVHRCFWRDGLETVLWFQVRSGLFQPFLQKADVCGSWRILKTCWETDSRPLFLLWFHGGLVQEIISIDVMDLQKLQWYSSKQLEQ